MPLVPASIDPTGKRDESQNLLDFVGSQPDGSRVTGRDGARYRADLGLPLANRWGLTFDGDCEIFTAYDASALQDPRRRNWSLVSLDGGGEINWGWRTKGPCLPQWSGIYIAAKGGQHGIRALGVKGLTVTGRSECHYGDGLYLGPSRSKVADKTIDNGNVSDPCENVDVVDFTINGVGRQGVGITGLQNAKLHRLTLGNIGRSAIDGESPAPYDVIDTVEISEFTIAGRVRNCVVACNGNARRVKDITIRDGDLGPKPFRMEFGGNVDRSGLKVLRVKAREMLKSTRNPVMVSGWVDVEIADNVMPMEARRQMAAVRLRKVVGHSVHGNTFPGGRVEYEVVDG
jgi:hypothetical protein